MTALKKKKEPDLNSCFILFSFSTRGIHDPPRMQPSDFSSNATLASVLTHLTKMVNMLSIKSDSSLSLKSAFPGT